MTRSLKILILVVIFHTFSLGGFASGSKSNKQVGFGLGGISAYPIKRYPYALAAVLEGTYLYKAFGLSIVASAVSSPSINGIYYFDSNGGYQQTLVEPRLYLSILHVGAALGLNLTERTNGTVESVASYGLSAGVELPLGRFSLGVDARYLWTTSTTNPAPLMTVAMFRFKI